jgi:chemotaxis protein CheD
MEPIVVGIAECRIADIEGQTLATFALGSCIALAVHDPVARVGGLLHFMLPDSSIDHERGRLNPCMFADTAIPAMLEAVAERGAARRRLIAHAAGGARMLDDSKVFDIGRRNYEALRRELAGAGISLQRAAVGGAVSRSLRLEIGTGRIWLWEGGMSRYVGESKNPGIDRR